MIITFADYLGYVYSLFHELMSIEIIQLGIVEGTSLPTSIKLGEVLLFAVVVPVLFHYLFPSSR